MLQEFPVGSTDRPEFYFGILLREGGCGVGYIDRGLTFGGINGMGAVA